MSNNNHPDDDFIAQLYNTSKKESEPPAALDSLILASAKQAVVDSVPEDLLSVADDVPKVVSLEQVSASAKTIAKKTKQRWHMPNSLAACLIVSVMVGLIYRENAGQLTISDSVEVDYYAPVVAKDSIAKDSVEKASAKEKADFSVIEELEEEVTEVQSEGLVFKAETRRVQERKRIPQQSDSLADKAVMVESIGTSVRLKESNVMSGAAPSVTEFKAKKKMQKSERAMPLPRQLMQPMMAAPATIKMIEAEDDSEHLEAQINKIRELRDSGDLGGALKVLNHVISQYPDVMLPEDIERLKAGLSAAE